MKPVESPTPPITLPRYDFLDGIRACLALFVVVNHIRQTITDQGRLSPLFRIEGGHYAVSFFIILSGFCLTLPVLKNGLHLRGGMAHFMKRRALRILPPYYFALLLSVALILLAIHDVTGTHWDVALPMTPRDVVVRLLLLQNFDAGHYYKVNHVLWSIAVEWQIYFFFPLLLLGWRVLGKVTTTVIAIAVSVVAEVAFADYLYVEPMVHYAGLFALGMLAAAFAFSAQRPAFPWKWIALGWLIIFLGLGALHDGNRPRMDSLFGLFAAALLVHLVRNPHGILHRCLDTRPLVFIGSFSYSLYLIHAPLLQLLWQYPFSPLQSSSNGMFVALMLAGIPIILAVSYLFYLFCERPFARMRDHLTVHVP